MPLVTMARALGFRTIVIDGRPRFATRERFPDVDDLRIGIPSELVRDVPLIATTALVLVAHDYKYDVPVLRHALGTPVGYIGLLGSSRRGAAILNLLREDGVAEDALTRVRVPIGLDLGAQSAAEIALSIMAEVLLVQRGATGMPISDKVRQGAQVKPLAVRRGDATPAALVGRVICHDVRDAAGKVAIDKGRTLDDEAAAKLLGLGLGRGAPARARARRSPRGAGRGAPLRGGRGSRGRGEGIRRRAVDARLRQAGTVPGSRRCAARGECAGGHVRVHAVGPRARRGRRDGGQGQDHSARHGRGPRQAGGGARVGRGRPRPCGRLRAAHRGGGGAGVSRAAPAPALRVLPDREARLVRLEPARPCAIPPPMRRPCRRSSRRCSPTAPRS